MLYSYSHLEITEYRGGESCVVEPRTDTQIQISIIDSHCYIFCWQLTNWFWAYTRQHQWHLIAGQCGHVYRPLDNCVLNYFSHSWWRPTFCMRLMKAETSCSYIVVIDSATVCSRYIIIYMLKVNSLIILMLLMLQVNAQGILHISHLMGLYRQAQYILWVYIYPLVLKGLPTNSLPQWVVYIIIVCCHGNVEKMKGLNHDIYCI